MAPETNIEVFVPRIPVYRAKDEDAVQKRVCVSTTIEGCVKAAPHFWYQAYEYVNADYYDPYTHMEKLTTLLDHDGKVGYLLKIYEFDLVENELVQPKILKANEWVPDALKTNEHWITKSTKPSRSYFILIEESKLENNEPVIRYTKYEHNELGRTESYLVTFERKNEKEIV